jgi:hypothetical protein
MKRPDLNDTLRDEGISGVRARTDGAKIYQLNGKGSDKSLLMSSATFVAGYVAPEYMINGIIQRRRLYSLTGKTGDGKTAIQLYLAYLLATGTKLGSRHVEECRVLYLAGENPDDVRARWIAMSAVLDFDADKIEVYFVEGVFSVSGMLERVTEEAAAIGDFGAIIVDTSAAYFEGDAENDNVQLGNHARLLRKLTEIGGKPAAIVGCHPIKSRENLLPRGGGAFLAEVDGNLTANKQSDEVIEMHWCGKYRGASFNPVMFRIAVVTSDRVKDAKGNLIPSVLVQPVDDQAAQEIEDREFDDDDQVLLLLDTTPGMSQSRIGEALQWGNNSKSKVNRALGRLVKARLLEKDRRSKYAPTGKGKAEANKLRNPPQTRGFVPSFHRSNPYK